MINYLNDYELSAYENEKQEEGPVLEVYGTDLTALARQGKLEECFGREKELLELMEILVRRQKNNPVLIGEPGVGKTAIIELFANKIVNNLVPFVLEGRTLISLNLAKIIAGARYRGEFELRFQKVLDEVLAKPNTIIFIDEIHNITGTGTAEGALDAANLLKPILSRSGFQCIGATTIKEYQNIEKDPALHRRFQPILVKEPSIEDTVQILYGLRPSLEAFHNVEILPGALQLAAELAHRYIQDRFLPDKAIDLVDRAAAKQVIKITNISEGSVIAALINAGLKNVSKLRIEAFRRGDIASEFIFQELENAYRSFMLRWIDDPLSIPEHSQPILSPLSQSLYTNMHLSLLSHVDKLLFASNKPRKKIQKVLKHKDLSANQNKKLLNEFDQNLNKSVQTANEFISIYRICNYLFGSWIEENELYDTEIPKNVKLNFFSQLITILNKHKISNYISYASILKEKQLLCVNEEDFFEEDIEEIEETYELLSELETNKIEVVKDFLKKLNPLLQKGIIESLKSSSQIPLSDDDLKTVYTLLGYFSTATGSSFLSNLEDPILIRQARKLGDFTGLKKRITQNEIRDLLAHMTGIPVNNLSSVETEKLANLETTLHKRVIGQEEAISAIAKAIRRSRLRLQNPNRPIASFFFCGPTGVGKTEVTKALAVSMFGSEADMIRFDMSEFMEKFTISRLIGSPPGYVGYEEGGQLTDAVRRKPYSVVLLDEIEKAHPDVLNILLQILEDGRLTDNQKRLIPFENTVIIMTSNAAAEEIQQIIKLEPDTEPITNKNEESKEFNSYEDAYAGVIKFLKSPIAEDFLTDIQKKLKLEFKRSIRNLKQPNILEKDLKKYINPKEKNNNVLTKLKSAVLERLNTMFLPEFLNRLDDIIIFQPLKAEELRKICDIMIATIIERVKQKNIVLVVDENVKQKLTREGYNPIFGARPLRRLVTKYVEDILSETLLQKSSLAGTKLKINIRLNEKGEVVASLQDQF